ncbi:carbohydrate kinase family protein [Ochrobactrum teleogrylli]|uniref:Carbohydrate kinase family protein n=1 Tax=Ochrobactrum teleogrylli TaxID=2479765 RepID=A0ABD5K3R2_9HYPH
MRPIAIIGNVNVDMILGPTAAWPQPGTENIVSHDELRVGGSAGNSALTLMALEVPFQMAANTGADQFGRWLAENFGDHARQWAVFAGKTTLSVGLTHPDGERTFFTTLGHLPHFSIEDALSALDSEALSGGLALLCGSFLTDRLADAYGQFFDWADSHNIEVALDTGWPVEGWTERNRSRALSWLKRSKFVMFNEVETINLGNSVDPVEAARNLCRTMPNGGLFIVKCGPNGAFAVGHDGSVISVNAPQVTVIDTIGAGDVFNAAFLASFAKGRSVEACLLAATRSASKAISTSPRAYMSDAEGALA